MTYKNKICKICDQPFYRFGPGSVCEACHTAIGGPPRKSLEERKAGHRRCVLGAKKYFAERKAARRRSRHAVRQTPSPTSTTETPRHD